jgi:hypothetical protein
MTMLKPHLGLYLFHYFTMKVTAMISDNLTQDTESSDILIENKEGDSIPIIFKCRHGLDPLSKLVYDHDNLLIPPSQSWVAIHKVHPPLGEGTNGNDWVKRGWVRAHFPSEHLVGVTLLNLLNAIFKDRWPKIISSQNCLGCCKPGYMTRTSPTMEIV